MGQPTAMVLYAVDFNNQSTIRANGAAATGLRLIDLTFFGGGLPARTATNAGTISVSGGTDVGLNAGALANTGSITGDGIRVNGNGFSRSFDVTNRHDSHDRVGGADVAGQRISHDHRIAARAGVFDIGGGALPDLEVAGDTVTVSANASAGELLLDGGTFHLAPGVTLAAPGGVTGTANGLTLFVEGTLTGAVTFGAGNGTERFLGGGSAIGTVDEVQERQGRVRQVRHARRGADRRELTPSALRSRPVPTMGR